MWWAIVWPFFVAVWAFLFVMFSQCYFGRGWADSAKRSLRWVAWLSVGVGGLITVLTLPAWLDWGFLYTRGVPVRAKVVNTNEEYDSDLERFVTHVTYQFEDEVGGESQQFRREGTLPGRYQMVSGFINVHYDPAAPANSRMTREFSGPRDGLIAAAVFLAIGVASLLLSSEPSRARPTPTAAGAAGGDKVVFRNALR